MKRIIYKAQNKENGMIYIGATTVSIEKRKADHEQKSKNGIGGYFQEAIGTFGPEAFNWEQIDTANNDNDLAEKEKQYIIEYKSNSDGYNSDVGGGFKKKVYQYNISDGSLVGEYESLLNASNVVSASKQSISNACLGQNKTCKGFYWSYTLTKPYIIKTDLRKKKVVKLDNKGNLVEVFNSVSEASRQTGVSKTCISRCCRGEREFSKGYIWKYI
tara:strand:+ start:1514 stop:2161 length:648 start_codon:yes stop_codon:yes gene_type:complete